MEQPEQLGPPQNQKPRRDRTVRTPGTRGGHYRRVWSEKLHKFYIKYGAPSKSSRIRSSKEEPNNDRSKAPDDPDTGGNMQSQQSSDAGENTPEQEEVLQGFFVLLMKNYKTEKTKDANTISINFGSVSPMNGGVQLDPSSKVAEFHVRTEDGTKVASDRQKVSDDEEVQKTFCYMVATYIVQEFMKQQQQQQGQEQPQQKSLMFRTGHRTAAGALLRKALRDAFLARMEEKQEVRPIIPAIPFEKMDELQKSVNRLRNPSRATQDNLSKSLDTTHQILSRLEKSAKSVWLKNAPYAGKRYGHVGSGSRTVFRRPGRPPGTGAGLTVASSGIRPDLRVDAGSKANAEVSLEDWAKNRDLKIGARAKVKHPYSHQRPIWGKISGIGGHGIQITDDEGNVTSIRWEHIQELSSRVENTPANAFEIAKLSIPVMGTHRVRDTDSELLEKLLRKRGIPLNDDVIHDGHDSRDAAYKELIGKDVPIDVIRATRVSVQPIKSGLAEHILQAASGENLPINMELLKDLPIKQMIEVLHHHYLNGQEK